MSGNRRRALGLGTMVLATAGLAGCGSGSDAVKAVPAAGTIIYKGKPLEQGKVLFVPAAGRSASGTVENGHFTLSTYSDGDGAIPGQHKVGVTATKEVPAKKGESEPGIVSIISPNYGSPDSSNLTVDIPPGGKTDIKLDLQ